MSWVIRKSTEDDSGNWVWHYWCSPPAYEGVDWVAALSNAQPFSREEAEGWLIKIGAPWYPQIVDRDELETIQIVRELAD